MTCLKLLQRVCRPTGETQEIFRCTSGDGEATSVLFLWITPPPESFPQILWVQGQNSFFHNFLALYAKSCLRFCHCINNDTPFMNLSSHLHLSVNQQERSSSQKGARLKSSLKNVQWPLLLFPSFPEQAEHQACWTKNSYFSETMIWGQKAGTSASRSHVTDSWRWSTQLRSSLSHNCLTNIQVWWVETHSLC